MDSSGGDSTNSSAKDEQTDNTPQSKDTSLEEGGKSETAKLTDEKDVPPASTSASDPVEKPEMDAGGKAAGKDSISAEKMDTTDVGSSRPQTTVETVNPANTSDLDAAAATLDSQVSEEKVNSEIPAVLKPPPEPVDIKIIYNKKKYDHSTDLNNTILDLKREIEKLTGVPVATQKVMYKGSTQDEQTLKQLKVTKSAKFMVIGSTINDLLKIATPTPSELQSSSDDKRASASKEPLCKQTAHKKVLDKYGKPEDVQAGIKGAKMALPQTPISGMYNKNGGKTRLTFKLDQDELWIGTKERTQKVKMGSIKAVVSEPIEGHEEYHVLGLQLGPTEASKYWIYWVPSQYVNAIKDTVLGQWETF